MFRTEIHCAKCQPVSPGLELGEYRHCRRVTSRTDSSSRGRVHSRCLTEIVATGTKVHHGYQAQLCVNGFAPCPRIAAESEPLFVVNMVVSYPYGGDLFHCLRSLTVQRLNRAYTRL